MDSNAIQRIAPWRPPFVMVDRVVECVPHEHIVTSKRVTAEDSGDCADAERGNWFPAMFLLEGLGQSAALLFRLTYGDEVARALPLLGFLSASLHGSAREGETITFAVKRVKMTRTGGVFEGEARSGDQVLAEGEFAFAARTGAAGEGDGAGEGA